MSAAALQQALQSCQERIDERLPFWLDKTRLAPRLNDAMHYACCNGGKRIRPLLVFATLEALGDDPSRGLDAACALEFIHAYSLVHDDLPAMDDDDLRRGKPSCHIAFDEATAILAGDALQTLAFSCILNSPVPEISDTAKIKILQVLSAASGAQGMVGGQMLDLLAEGKQLDQRQLEQIHRHKTGALISASVEMATLIATECSHNKQTALLKYADSIGLAFQVWDDVLDIIGETATLGKTQGGDLQQQKSTYPKLLGLEAAQHYANRLNESAQTELALFDHKADTLRALSHYIISRTH